MDTGISGASPDFIQVARILKIVSPLGEYQLLAERLTIEEGVSQLFEIRLYARTKKEQIKLSRPRPRRKILPVAATPLPPRRR